MLTLERSVDIIVHIKLTYILLSILNSCSARWSGYWSVE